MTKTCPGCGNEHKKDGQYCGQLCANRMRTAENKANAKAGARSYYANMTPEQLAELRKRSIAGGLACRGCPKRATTERFKAMSWSQLSAGWRRRRVIEEQDAKCNGCRLREWRGLPLTLELEHKDGDRMNNARENVEALCPNCHSQTKTWRGRGVGAAKKGISDETMLAALDAYDNIGAALGSLGLNRGGWNFIRAKQLLTARSLKDRAIGS